LRGAGHGDGDRFGDRGRSLLAPALLAASALDRPVISLMGYTNPKRTGPYRKFKDLLIDAYGDPGEDYPISMENRPGRMRRIETSQVLEKVQVWRDRYAREAGR